MTALPERRRIIELIQEAVANGARLHKACAEAQVALRTYRRWYRAGQVQADQRPEVERREPANKLSQQEQEQIIELCNQKEFVDLPPTQIVPTLMDQGVYIASESSFYRVLRANGQQHHRGKASAPQRKLVGYEVYEEESGAHAVTVLQRSLLSEQCFNKPVVLHSDNGSPMKSHTLKAKLEELGVLPSYSRPRVSNDNAYAESVFRTLKYRPQWPSNGFKDLTAARQWVERFVHWYNYEHKHSKIRFVTPQQRHSGEDAQILQRRKEILEQAKQSTPSRWGGRPTRNCTPIGAVCLNPERDDQIVSADKQAA